MAQYIHPDNQSLLWDVLHASKLFVRVFPTETEQMAWFRDVMQTVYQQRIAPSGGNYSAMGGQPVSLTPAMLETYNRETMAYMVQELQHRVQKPYERPHENQGGSASLQIPSLNMIPVADVRKPKSDIEQRMAEHQRDFDHYLGEKRPTEIDFRMDQVDTPLDNTDIETLIKHQKEERMRLRGGDVVTPTHSLRQLRGEDAVSPTHSLWQLRGEDAVSPTHSLWQIYDNIPTALLPVQVPMPVQAQAPSTIDIDKVSLLELRIRDIEQSVRDMMQTLDECKRRVDDNTRRLDTICPEYSDSDSSSKQIDTDGEDSDVDRGDVDRGDVDRGDVDRGDVDRGDVDRGDVDTDEYDDDDFSDDDVLL